MTRIDRRAAGRSLGGARIAHVFGFALALGVIGAGAPFAADNSKEIFDILDDDHDGLIRREEFLRTKIEVFYRALENMDQDQRLSPEQINITPQAFADADLDGDGRMSGAEFVQARFTQFEAIDANGDQEITFEEFREFMRRYQL